MAAVRIRDPKRSKTRGKLLFNFRLNFLKTVTATKEIFILSSTFEYLQKGSTGIFSVSLVAFVSIRSVLSKKGV